MIRPTARHLSWQDYALCREVGEDAFFTPGLHHTDVRAAKAVCSRCPVQKLCLDYALTVPLIHPFENNRTYGWVEGIWGGTSFNERERRRRERGIVDETEED